MTEADWIHKLQTGHPDAAPELFRRYHRALYAYVRQLGHADSDTRDILQETFIAAWKNLMQLRAPAALTTWLYRICTNTARAHVRRAGPSSTELSETFAANLPDTATPARLLETAEQNEMIRALVVEQPYAQREVIILHYFHGHSLAECAEILDQPSGTVKSRLTRGLRDLKEQLRKKGIISESEAHHDQDCENARNS